MISIFFITSTGSGAVNFGELVGKGIKEEILEAFRATLNEIQGFNIPKDVIRLGKYPSIRIELLTRADSLNRFEDAVLALYQQIES